MQNKQIHIVIVDDGVNLEGLSVPLYKNIEVLEDLSITYSPSYGTGHAMKIYMLIQKFIKVNYKVSSIKVLDDNHFSSVEKLCKGLELAKKIGADIINLSIGSSKFYDRSQILDIVNKLYAERIIIVAASDNLGKLTFPASFSNVIGVKSNRDKKIIESPINFLGIDLELYTNYKIDDKFIGEHNSYAAPIASALIANSYNQIINTHGDIVEISKRIISEKYCESRKMSICFSLDWLNSSCLLIIGNESLYNELLEIFSSVKNHLFLGMFFFQTIKETEKFFYKNKDMYNSFVVCGWDSHSDENIEFIPTFKCVFIDKKSSISHINGCQDIKKFGYYREFFLEREPSYYIGLDEPLIFIHELPRIVFLKMIDFFKLKGFNLLVISDDPYLILFEENYLYLNDYDLNNKYIDFEKITNIISSRNIDIVFVYIIQSEIDTLKHIDIDLFIIQENGEIRIENLGEVIKKFSIKKDNINLISRTLFEEVSCFFK